jgi:hypothetical protein
VPDWLPQLIQTPKWRQLIYTLSRQHPDCQLLNFTIQVEKRVDMIDMLAYFGSWVPKRNSLSDVRFYLFQCIQSCSSRNFGRYPEDQEPIRAGGSSSRIFGTRGFPYRVNETSKCAATTNTPTSTANLSYRSSPRSLDSPISENCRRTSITGSSTSTFFFLVARGSVPSKFFSLLMVLANFLGRWPNALHNY